MLLYFQIFLMCLLRVWVRGEKRLGSWVTRTLIQIKRQPNKLRCYLWRSRVINKSAYKENGKKLWMKSLMNMKDGERMKSLRSVKDGKSIRMKLSLEWIAGLTLAEIQTLMVGIDFNCRKQYFVFTSSNNGMEIPSESVKLRVAESATNIWNCHIYYYHI